MHLMAELAVSEDAALDRLDRALLASRQWFRRPGHRRRFWDRLGVAVEVTTVRVLRAVEQHEADGPTVGDVAAELGVAPSTGSRLVDRVVERGDLKRRACATDRRRTRLVLTARGRQTLAQVTRARQQVLGEVTAGWSSHDVGLLADLLDRLGERFDDLDRHQ